VYPSHIEQATRKNPSAHHSRTLLLQSQIRRYDKPGRDPRASRQTGSPLGRSTDCFKSASLPRGSARPSRLAIPQFRDELS